MELIHIPRIDSFTNALKDNLIQFCLPLEKCRCQAYNGTSNMSSYFFSIVGVRIQIEAPLAIIFLYTILHTACRLVTQLIQCALLCFIPLKSTVFRISMSQTAMSYKVDFLDNSRPLYNNYYHASCYIV